MNWRDKAFQTSSMGEASDGAAAHPVDFSALTHDIRYFRICERRLQAGVWPPNSLMRKTLYSEQAKLFLAMLRQARVVAGRTQAELASELGVDQTFISKSERGIRRLDVVELHGWLLALGSPALKFFASLDEELTSIAARNNVVRPQLRGDKR